MWIDEYYAIKPLFAVKWCIILAKHKINIISDAEITHQINNYLDLKKIEHWS